MKKDQNPINLTLLECYYCINILASNLASVFPSFSNFARSPSGRGIKPLSDLIGKTKVYDGNLKIDTLVLSDKLGFTISVHGSTTCVINTDMDKLIEE